MKTGTKQRDNNDDDEEKEDKEERSGNKLAKGFFEAFDRVPSGISFEADLLSSDSDDDDDNDDNVRISFTSALAPPSFRRLSDFDNINLPEIREEDEENEERNDQADAIHSYGIWLSEPMSVKDRRNKLLQGMGLTSNMNHPSPLAAPVGKRSRSCLNTPLAQSRFRPPSSRFSMSNRASFMKKPALLRSQSDSELCFSRRSALSKLFRVSSVPPSQSRNWSISQPECLVQYQERGNDAFHDDEEQWNVKNDNAEELIVRKPEEVEQSVGASPIVKEVLRRVASDTNNTSIVDANGNTSIVDANNASSFYAHGTIATVSASILRTFSPKLVDKSTKPSKKKANWLKNIKSMASTMLMSDKEKEALKEEKSSSSERLKVHQSGKSTKELTGLYMCQEIQAHQGSIWTMKFSCDSKYLASAGEDRVVRIWKVLECDSMSSSMHRQNQPESPSKPSSLLKGGMLSFSKSNKLTAQPSKKDKKSKGSGIPDHLVVPDTIFSLSEEPLCSLEGHTEDVLDLSWSKSQVRTY